MLGRQWAQSNLDELVSGEECISIKALVYLSSQRNYYKNQPNSAQFPLWPRQPPWFGKKKSTGSNLVQSGLVQFYFCNTWTGQNLIIPGTKKGGKFIIMKCFRQTISFQPAGQPASQPDSQIATGQMEHLKKINWGFGSWWKNFWWSEHDER